MEKYLAIFMSLFLLTNSLFNVRRSAAPFQRRSVPQLLDAELEKMGVHGEMVGDVIPDKTVCGTLLLDTHQYTSGKIFQNILENMTLAHSWEKRLTVAFLQKKAFDHEVSSAFVGHTNDMTELFNSYRQVTEQLQEETRKASVGVGFIATFLLGGVVIPVVTRYLTSWMGLTTDHGFENNYDKKIEEMTNRTESYINFSLYQMFRSNYAQTLGHIREVIATEVRDALNEIFVMGRLPTSMLKFNGQGSVITSIEQMLGSEMFDKMLISKRGIRSANVISATAESMNHNSIKIKLCFPVATMEDVLPVIELRAFASVVKDSFELRQIHHRYAIPEGCNNVLCLLPIPTKCPMLGEFDVCSIMMNHNVSRALQFDNVKATIKKETIVQSILYDTVVSTRATGGKVYKSDGSVELIQFGAENFVLRIPQGNTVQIGNLNITSRMATSEASTSFIPKPFIPTDNGEEVEEGFHEDIMNFSKQKGGGIVITIIATLLIACVTLGVTMFLFFWFLNKKMNSMKVAHESFIEMAQFSSE